MAKNDTNPIRQDPANSKFTKHFDDADDFVKAVIETVSQKQVGFLYSLWHNMIEATPTYSGTLRMGWRMQPNVPSKFVPVLHREPLYYPEPPAPVLHKYNNKIEKRMYLTNNVPYIGQVNDDSKGYNAENFRFIERAIDAAVKEWEGDNV